MLRKWSYFIFFFMLSLFLHHFSSWAISDVEVVESIGAPRAPYSSLNPFKAEEEPTEQEVTRLQPLSTETEPVMEEEEETLPEPLGEAEDSSDEEGTQPQGLIQSWCHWLLTPPPIHYTELSDIEDEEEENSQISVLAAESEEELEKEDLEHANSASEQEEKEIGGQFSEEDSGETAFSPSNSLSNGESFPPDLDETEDETSAEAKKKHLGVLGHFYKWFIGEDDSEASNIEASDSEDECDEREKDSEALSSSNSSTEPEEEDEKSEDEREKSDFIASQEPEEEEIHINNAAEGADDEGDVAQSPQSSQEVEPLLGVWQAMESLPGDALLNEQANQERSLVTLDFSGRQLEEFVLDDTDPSLDEVGRLNLSYNSLHNIPDCLSLSFSNLRELNVAHNNLRNFPLFLGLFSHLRILNIAHNQLTSLPSSLRSLEHLENLDASHNRIQEVRGLPSGLRALDLANNNLRQWPAVLEALPRLFYLDIRDNRLPNTPSERLLSNMRRSVFRF